MKRCPVHPPLTHRRAAVLWDADNLLGTVPAHAATSMAATLIQWLHAHNGLSIATHRAYANPSTRALGHGRTLQALVDATDSELVPVTGRRCDI